MRFQRGTALAEVAVVVSFTLIMLFGILQFVLLGYYQIASDAAVFFGAHQYALGYTSMNNLQTAGLFPSVVGNVITNPAHMQFNATVPAGFSSDQPVNFNLASTTTRDGGVSLVIPQTLQASFTTPVSGLFTIIPAMNSQPLSSGSVEGFYQQAAGYYDAQGLGYGNQSTYLNNLTNPLGNNHTSLDMNTPPYFSSQQFMRFCTGDPSTPTTNVAFGYTCNRGTERDEGVGMAEYLDNSNYANPGGYGVQTSTQDTFQAMSCHQRIFLALLNAFPASPSNSAIAALQQVYQTNTVPPGAAPDLPTAGALPAAALPFTANAAFYDGYAGIAYSNPGSGHKWTQTLDANGVPIGPFAGAALATVWSWDQWAIQPIPTAPPYYPLNGCAAGEPGA